MNKYEYSEFKFSNVAGGLERYLSQHLEEITLVKSSGLNRKKGGRGGSSLLVC